jgi:uncharacterized protein (TIGR00299 family) protein
MRTLYLDCYSGVSGDMLLGALLDLGVPIAELRGALGSLAIEGCEVSVGRVLRGGIAAAKFTVTERPHDHPHHHDHDDVAQPGPHHGHRTLEEIVALIDGSALSPGGRTRAVELFRRLAQVEAGIHQMPVEQVHLHEVGALDSIVDIVGAVFALEWLAADRVVSSPLNVGSGTVHTAHGVLPVPAPATAALLTGVPIYASGPAMELVTPTGALLVTAFATSYGPLPAMRLDRIGYGAGDRDPGTHANVLRVFLGESEGQASLETVVVIECEIDDMNPQNFGTALERLQAAGALDVYYTPIQMKKNRPGVLVTVLCTASTREVLAGILFRETTTIGLRYQEMTRECLDRESLAVETPLGPVRFKIARRRGQVVNASPEFEDCLRLSRERQVPLKDVQALATKAYLDLR